MKLDKQIALQISRIENLRTDVFERKTEATDAERPEKMRRERTETIRKAVADLHKRREATIARFDKEIAELEAELKSLDSSAKVDLGGTRIPGGRTGRKPVKPAQPLTRRSASAKKPTKKTP